MADYALKQKQAKEISAMLCAKENELTDAVAHLQKELAEKKTELYFPGRNPGRLSQDTDECSP